MNKIELFHTYQRRYFEPGSKNDMKEVRHYFHNHQWGKEGCPFYLEWPYLTIPDMLKDKITQYALKGE